MKAMQITSFDGPAGLKYAEAPAPEPGPEDVALDVEYAGVGYIEALLAGGLIDLPLPYVPGLEAVGRVRSLGSLTADASSQTDAHAGVEAEADTDGEADADGHAGPDADGEAGFSSPGLYSPLKPGDPVVALTINRGGAYGQVAVTHANLVAPLPPGMDPALAAAVPANTTTALVALERVAHLKPGEHVLVHAAAGGLGSQFGQIARLLGAARTVGVVGSEAKRGAALDLGYDEVWLRSELGDAAGGQFDVVVDPVAGPARQTSLDLLRLGGRLLAVGDAAQAGDPMVSSNSLWLRGVGVLGFNLGAFTAANPRTTGVYLRRALNLAASGEVAVHIAERAPIREAPRVLADMAAGATVGKAVLVHERER
ncbi:NADPH:quinone reductase [Peptidiphaga gingivicola]|uniref:NADPH:quinone reductase n=1 Tax=Peptidiphaga gingivicola TaxID=2741497 RepID=A0A179B746_9ACTO|nr:zinc-binding dehydrogenase [Peptidiphaga gingivicola]OAP87073.1 NADPH:quinone reductase [Peptidiphaga gingivicola]